VNAAMKLINRSFRQLREQIADPEKKEESLKLVGDIEKARRCGEVDARPG